jgi:hypothetical protein
MLHEQTVDKTTLELLIKLMNDNSFNNFILVGGTALALQIGHRKSIDLDLFTNAPFNENQLVDLLRSVYNFELDFISTNTVKGEIKGTQIDCIAHLYPWLEKHKLYDSIRLAGFADIAAMKLNAISGNGTRLKDFIDIAFLSTHLNLNQMLQAYKQKYKSNPVMPLKAISYFNDINFNEPILMTGIKQFKWGFIKKRIIDMQKFPNRLFDKIEM